MARRKEQYPFTQRHHKGTGGCRGRDDDNCPWTFRKRINGEQIRRTADSYAELEMLYLEVMGEKRRGDPITDRHTTVAEWAHRWLASGPTRGWADNTQDGRTSAVANYIAGCAAGCERHHAHVTPPVLAGLLVTAVRPQDVRNWAQWMEQLKQGKCRSARYRAVEVLTTMFKDWAAEGYRLPLGVPVPRRLVPGPEHKDFAPLTDAQVEAIAVNMGPAGKPDLANAVRVAGWYALRANEVLGLREEDVSFTGIDRGEPLWSELARLAELPDDEYKAAQATMRVWEQVNRQGERVKLKNPGRGKRKVPLPRWLALDLAAQFEQWPPFDGFLWVNREHRAGGRGDQPKATAQQVADECGVSVSQVWRTLSKAPSVGTGVSDATRAKVTEAAHRLGYLAYQPYEYEIFRQAFVKAVKLAGVTLPPNQALHSLLHHRVTVLTDMGKNDMEIGKYVGKSPVTVARYGRPWEDSNEAISDELEARRNAPDEVAARRDRRRRAAGP